MTEAPTKPRRRERRIVARKPSRSWNSATVPIKPIGMMPAARAAKTQSCFGMNSPSASGNMPADKREILGPDIEPDEARMGARDLGDAEEGGRGLDHRDQGASCPAPCRARLRARR